MILRALFVDGRCLVSPGYTLYAIEALKTTRVTFNVGEPKTFGGAPSEEAISNALHRMARWVIMAAATIDAEFPGFELKTCFKVFTLADADHGLNNNSTARDAIYKLAEAFGVNPEAAQREYFDLLPLAIRKKTTSGQKVSNFEAWSRARFPETANRIPQMPNR